MEKYKAKYDVADVVIFRKNRTLEVGVIEGYHVEDGTVWYMIRINSNYVYTHSVGGDIGEHDIIGKVENDLKEACKLRIGHMTNYF